jgi:hypothetical protein
VEIFHSTVEKFCNTVETFHSTVEKFCNAAESFRHTAECFCNTAGSFRHTAECFRNTAGSFRHAAGSFSRTSESFRNTSEYFRHTADASRASMHPDADGIEMRYHLGGTAPANANACPGVKVSTKALFDFDAGIDNDGKKFYCFLRYINQSNPENNGHWSGMQSGTVQG